MVGKHIVLSILYYCADFTVNSSFSPFELQAVCATTERPLDHCLTVGVRK